MTANTARLVEGFFELRDLGSTPVKRSRDPVQPDLSFAVAHRALGGMAPDVDRRMSVALRKAGLE